VLNRSILMVSLVMVAGPAIVSAQQDFAPVTLPSEAQAVITEMQQIHNRLRPMQEQAMQDQTLKQEGDALGASILRAMEELEPATASLIARLNELAPQVQAAQNAQDRERLVTLATEAGEIDQLLQIARAEAVERPDIVRLVEAYEEKVHDKMVEDNPDAAGLLERLDVLNGQLATLLQTPAQN
jgi:hypothetical protein